jgi:ribosomal protein S18 acetylase RimI-like enzyme
MSTVTCRPARLDDAKAAADLMAQAGGDVLQFVLDEVAPEVRVLDLLVHMFAKDDNECSRLHCRVAECDGVLAGVVNAFPTALLKDVPDAALSSRERHLKARTDLKDEDSYRLNMIAVDPRFRRLGIASRLLRLAADRALAAGFDRVSLHVWADNESARAFYRARGFVEVARAEVDWHPALPHEGGSILMALPLTPAARLRMRAAP